MYRELICVTVLLVLVDRYDGAVTDDAQAMTVFRSAYYDPKSGLALKSEIEDSGRNPFTRIGYRGLPCACETMSCGCCAGINLTTINFDRKACSNFTYDPYDFAIKMDVSMNGMTIYNNSISAKNPPPICMPLPYLPVIDFCIRFYNIFMPGNNLHACVDFETRVVQSPILVMHFDCVRMGADGIAWVKPEDNGGLGRPQVSTAGPIVEPAGSEVYDEVNFEANDSEFASTDTSTLSPEDEDKIGQLKL